MSAYTLQAIADLGIFNPCSKLLPCGHPCPNDHGEPCEKQCKQKTLITLKCTHKKEVPCHLRYASWSSTECQNKCKAILQCQHTCPGTCSACCQGRIHVACSTCLRKCNGYSLCGHSCNAMHYIAEQHPPCNQRCETKCVHRTCKKRCGEPCDPCTEKCSWRCPHYECTKLCYEKCNRPVCTKPCLKILKCGHRCIGLCGEKCPTLCRKCNLAELTEFMLGHEEDDDAMFIQLTGCGHCVEIRDLKNWLVSGDSAEPNLIKMKGCPNCTKTMWEDYACGDVIKSQFFDVNKAKELVFGEKEGLQNTMRELQLKIANNQELRVNFGQVVDQLERQVTRGNLLHYNELVVIENQLKVLIAAVKVKKRVGSLNSQSTKKFLNEGIDYVVGRLMEMKEVMIIGLFDDVIKELTRIEFQTLVTNARRMFNKYDGDTRNRLKNAADLLGKGSKLSNEEEKGIEQCLNKVYKCGGISEEEKVMVVKAMGLKKGSWFKCPKGHYYTIGECGGAMERGVCNECKSVIGGGNHALHVGNSLAPEMDGATHAAWSNQAGLGNFRF